MSRQRVVPYKRLSLVCGNDHILIIRYYTDQWYGQDVHHIIRRHHISAFYHIKTHAVDNEVYLAEFMSFQQTHNSIRITYGGNLRSRDYQSAVGTGYGILKPLLDARRTVQYDIIKLILKMLH